MKTKTLVLVLSVGLAAFLKWILGLPDSDQPQPGHTTHLHHLRSSITDQQAKDILAQFEGQTYALKSSKTLN